MRRIFLDRPAGVFGALIGALALILAAALVRAEDIDPSEIEPQFDSCSQQHPDKDAYIAALVAEGWTEAADRDAALAALRDAFLALHMPPDSDGTWNAVVAYRDGAAMADLVEVAGDRAILENDGAYLLLAGYRAESGNLVVECSVAFADDTITEAFLAASDAVTQEGIRALRMDGPVEGTDLELTMFVLQTRPDSETEPPLAARDGILSRLVIPAPSN